MLLKIIAGVSIVCVLLQGSEIAYAASNEPVLRHGTYALPVSLDPAWGTTTGDSMLKVNIYEGLTTYDAAGHVVPGAAKHWEVSEDGLQYTFYLRKGLRWSDGSPLTAQQFANTVLRVIKGGGDNQPTLHYTLLKNANEILQKQQPLSALGMEVIGRHILRFELTRPTPYFPEILVFTGLPTPGSMKDSVSLEELKPAQWVTNGAYQISTYDSLTREYQFARNPFYRKSEDVYFKTVRLQKFPKSNQALFALISGQLDSYERYGSNQLKAIEVEKALLKVIPLAAATTDYITLNIRDEALKNQQVRKALSMALDRSAIVTALGYSDAQRTFSFSPSYPSVNWQKLPASWGKETLISRRKRALKIMTKAGFGLNKRLQMEFLVNKGNANELLAEQVRRQWETIGVDIKVISHPTSLHYGNYLRKGHYQIARAGWSANYPDPAGFLELFHQQQQGNFGHWENAIYTQKINQLQQQQLTPKQRTDAFLSLETMIQQEVPVIPIYNKTYVALLAPWLKAVNQQPTDYMLWRHFQPEENTTQ